MATAKELQEQAQAASDAAQAAAAEADRLAEEYREAVRREHQAAQASRYAEHYDRLFTETGQSICGLNAAQHAAVYALAYERGHSAGLDYVEECYGEFAELARKILEAR